MSTPTTFEDQVTGAKVLLIKADGSEIEVADWKRVTHKETYFKVVNNKGAELDYEIIQAPIAQPQAIQYGCMFAQMDSDQEQALMKQVGLKMIRIPVFYMQNPINKTIDNFLIAGFNVQINFNSQPTSTAVAFPTDSTLIRANAETFFSYYQKWIKQIPVVVVENEWDNPLYHLQAQQFDASDYANELAIITEVGHKYGFKIADAGITSNGLRKWYYSTLSPEAQMDWSSKYFTGRSNPDYSKFVDMVNKYALAAINIPFDYSNTHWYNDDVCNNGYGDAAKTFAFACSKTQLANNEFGIKTNSVDLFKQTVNEIRSAGALIIVAYSGVNSPGQAVQLTTEMLKDLNNTI